VIVTVHDHPYDHVTPDILSLEGDPLPGNGCGSPYHTYIWLFLFVYLLIYTWYKEKGCCTKSKANHVLFT